ncbi:predicted protein [Plenodomus lingam JN3]|uniref:Predicted protein n=1 Tax=Leptosphaeria maculans (strain JN3 / isolate v23.1.3 / race Av1-4-5-6-7-8) TaxID=985895 RepID=E4ZP86_LEPMJ|nr:predicted protein [Plenodomus lingam JN3]CBX93111.1 predicted protein [Plenodomus lingam JN3]
MHGAMGGAIRMPNRSFKSSLASLSGSSKTRTKPPPLLGIS